ncbi:hypothetical protein FKP32DRAFT_1100579 [Trametes sanguinea]|nr:hypothetical protein FKP32DRAFT_1100579 [Trametes sanguinea]
MSSSLTVDPDNFGNNLQPLPKDVLYNIANSIDLVTLQSWRATCRIADRTASRALTLRYTSTLRTFVDNPTGFRNILRLTKSIISGSTALNILDIDRASNWTPTDLDIYTPHHAVIQMLVYLTKIEGYDIINDPPQYSFPSGGFTAVYRLRRGTKTINVIQSATCSALHPLPHFWATHVMNYITSDTFCIAYPEYTLNGKALLNPIHLIDNLHAPPRTVANITKYTARGYDIRTRTTAWSPDPLAPCDNRAACPQTIRFFGDKFCLMGSFDDHSQPPIQERAQPDATKIVRWWRGGPPCGGTCTHTYNAHQRSIPCVQTRPNPLIA